METSSATLARYARHALSQMLAVGERLGEPAVNVRPLGPETNSVAALIVHCCGVAEFWLGHVGLGRASHRDRDSELTSTATLEELRALVGATLRQLEADVEALDAGVTSSFASHRQHLLDGDRSDASLVMHVIEELFQHLGHAELAADALLR